MNTTFVKEEIFAEHRGTIDLVLEASFLSDAQKEAILDPGAAAPDSAAHHMMRPHAPVTDTF